MEVPIPEADDALNAPRHYVATASLTIFFHQHSPNCCEVNFRILLNTVVREEGWVRGIIIHVTVALWIILKRKHSYWKAHKEWRITMGGFFFSICCFPASNPSSCCCKKQRIGIPSPLTTSLCLIIPFQSGFKTVCCDTAIHIAYNCTYHKYWQQR